MPLLILSFIAGVLTVLAPCVLPLLPLIIGGSVEDNKNRKAPFIIVGSLALSIIVFTLLLKVSTALISIPQSTWTGISGGILIIFGLITFFPTLWENFSARLNLAKNPNRWLAVGFQKKNVLGNIIIGLSFGPIFSTCSPTYSVILATVLPQNFSLGIVYLLAYVLGFSIVLLLIAFLGQKFVNTLNIFSDPHGKFKRGLGVLFFVIGVFIIFGFDKVIEAKLINSNYFDVTKIENTLLQKNK